MHKSILKTKLLLILSVVGIRAIHENEKRKQSNHKNLDKHKKNNNFSIAGVVAALLLSCSLVCLICACSAQKGNNGSIASHSGSEGNGQGVSHTGSGGNNAEDPISSSNQNSKSLFFDSMYTITKDKFSIKNSSNVPAIKLSSKAKADLENIKAEINANSDKLETNQQKHAICIYNMLAMCMDKTAIDLYLKSNLDVSKTDDNDLIYLFKEKEIFKTSELDLARLSVAIHYSMLSQMPVLPKELLYERLQNEAYLKAVNELDLDYPEQKAEDQSLWKFPWKEKYYYKLEQMYANLFHQIKENHGTQLPEIEKALKTRGFVHMHLTYLTELEKCMQYINGTLIYKTSEPNVNLKLPCLEVIWLSTKNSDCWKKGASITNETLTQASQDLNKEMQALKDMYKNFQSDKTITALENAREGQTQKIIDQFINIVKNVNSQEKAELTNFLKKRGRYDEEYNIFSKTDEELQLIKFLTAGAFSPNYIDEIFKKTNKELKDATKAKMKKELEDMMQPAMKACSFYLAPLCNYDVTVQTYQKNLKEWLQDADVTSLLSPEKQSYITKRIEEIPLYELYEALKNSTEEKVISLSKFTLPHALNTNQNGPPNHSIDTIYYLAHLNIKQAPNDQTKTSLTESLKIFQLLEGKRFCNIEMSIWTNALDQNLLLGAVNYQEDSTCKINPYVAEVVGFTEQESKEITKQDFLEKGLEKMVENLKQQGFDFESDFTKWMNETRALDTAKQSLVKDHKKIVLRPQNIPATMGLINDIFLTKYRGNDLHTEGLLAQVHGYFKHSNFNIQETDKDKEVLRLIAKDRPLISLFGAYFTAFCINSDFKCLDEWKIANKKI